MNVNGNLGKEPNYLSTSKKYQFIQQSKPIQQHQEVWSGPAMPVHWATSPGDIDFVQARDLYNKVLSKQPGQQKALAHNVAVHVASACPEIQDRVFAMFARVDRGLSENIKKEALSLSPRKAAALNAKL